MHRMCSFMTLGMATILLWPKRCRKQYSLVILGELVLKSHWVEPSFCVIGLWVTAMFSLHTQATSVLHMHTFAVWIAPCKWRRPAFCYCDMPNRVANTDALMQDMSYICWIQAQYDYQSSNEKWLRKTVSTMSQHSSSLQCTSSSSVCCYSTSTDMVRTLWILSV